MSAKVTSLLGIYASAFVESDVPIVTVRVPCPGIAHKTEETCLICDAETNGSIDVLFSTLDCEALSRSAHGLLIDANLALRLSRLGLVETVEMTYIPTQRGYEVLGDLAPVTVH